MDTAKHDERSELVAVVGAGAMGSGIAQIAACAGHAVLLYDAAPGAATRAVSTISERVSALVAKGKISPAALPLRLSAISSLDDLTDAGVVIEAIVEDLDAKRSLFAAIEKVVSPHALLATNTSSLSPTMIAAALELPSRFIGLHFFNPVPLMALAEIVPGLATDERTVAEVIRLARSWGKTTVRSTSTPGFIVNRVARPYYAEAWQLLEEGVASPAVIDRVLVRAGGFRMGPFALMDLIGHDVNEAVTRTVSTGLGSDPRFPLSLLQQELVAARWLGRKTGRGVYDYSDLDSSAAVAAAPQPPPATVDVTSGHGFGKLLVRAGIAERETSGAPAALRLPAGGVAVRCTGATAAEEAAALGCPVIVVDRTLDDDTATAVSLAVSPDCTDTDRDAVVGLLQAGGIEVFVVDDAPGLVVTRTVAMLANIAFDAVHHRVADEADVDVAMRLGTNYPLGPIAWAQRWGLATTVSILRSLCRIEGESRYRISPLLQRRALAETIS